MPRGDGLRVRQVVVVSPVPSGDPQEMNVVIDEPRPLPSHLREGSDQRRWGMYWAMARDTDNPAEMQQAIREHTQESGGVAPSGAAITPAQAKGGISGGLLGGLIGAVVGALIGLMPLFDMSLGLRVAIIAGVCAVSGSTIGALMGGFFRPDAEGETSGLPGEGPRDIARERSGHAE